MSMVAMVVCFAVLMCSQRLEAGSQVSKILPTAHLLPSTFHADNGSNSHPKKVSYPAVPAEEAEDGDERPVNAKRLTALLLVAFMGAGLGLLLGGKLLLRRSRLVQTNGRRCLPSFGRPSPQRPTAPLISVFRL
jgi:hypothetical protein